MMEWMRPCLLFCLVGCSPQATTAPPAPTPSTVAPADARVSTLAPAREKARMGEVYVAWQTLLQSSRPLSPDEADFELELLTELRDIPRLKTQLEQGSQATRDARLRAKQSVRTFLPAEGLDRTSRLEYEKEVHELALAVRAQAAGNEARFKNLCARAESAELWLQGALIAKGREDRSGARRRLDAAATLARNSSNKTPRRLASRHDKYGNMLAWPARHLVWAGLNLLDVETERLIAHVAEASTLEGSFSRFTGTAEAAYSGYHLWCVLNDQVITKVGYESPAAFSSSGAFLFTQENRDSEIFRYDAETGKKELIGTWPNRSRPDLYVSPSGNRLYATSVSLETRVFDLTRPSEAPRFLGYNAMPLADGWQAVWHHEEGKFTLIHSETKRKLSYAWKEPPNLGPMPTARSLDGRMFSVVEMVADERLVFAVPDEDTPIPRTLKPKAVYRFRDHERSIRSIAGEAFSPNNELMVGVTQDKLLVFHELPSFKVRRTLDPGPILEKEYCLYGIRTYPLEVCLPRLEWAKENEELLQ